MEVSVLIKLAVSLALGLLLGLERERTEASVAGIRTFALISLMGTICGLLGLQFGGWVVATGLAALAVLLVIANFARVKGGDIDPGLTTEFAATLLYGVGAYLAYGQTSVAVALGGTIALLLHGGLISSTATTISQARRSAEAGSARWPAALIIMVASTVLYARVLVLIAIIAMEKFLQLGPPLAVMMAACGIIVAAGFRLAGKHPARMTPPQNPAELKSALILGALYAVIRLAAAAAKEHFGSGGLFAVAALSGLVDVDAVTLSTAQLINGGGVETGMGWRVILMASMSNLVFKAGVVAWLGGRGLLREIAWLFGAAMLAGTAILWLWPR